MKLSTSTAIINFDKGKPYQVSVDVSARTCAEAGYKDIDISLCGYSRTGQPLSLEDWELWVNKVRALGEELEVKFSQAHAYWTIGNAFNPDLSRVDGEWGEELMRRSVIAAERLGVKWMVVHPYTIRPCGWYDYKKSFAYNREYFKRWGDIYAEHHVGMAIENMIGPRGYCSCAEELLELREAINHPSVEICIDTGHAHLSGFDVAEMIRQVGPHLKATHIADNHGNKDEHFIPFNGTINWTEVMKALREINYQECFAFEIHNLSSMYPKEVQAPLVKFSYEMGQYLLAL